MAEFKNPSQQGGGGQDSRSLLVMMFVMVAVFFGLQYFRGKSNPQTASPSSPAATQSAPAQPGPQPGSQPSPQAGAPAAPAPRAAAGAPAAASAVPIVQAPAESTTTIENELYRVTFTNRGGQVSSWFLKNYKDSDGKPLNLVHEQAAKSFGYPLSLYTYDPSITAAVNNALYVPSATGNLAAPANLTFKYSDGNLQVTKTFSFDETYVLHADVVVTRAGAPIRTLVSWPGGFGDQDNANAYAGSSLDFTRDGKEQHLEPKKVSGGETINGPFDWAGVSGPYFAAIFLPDNPQNATIATLHNQLDVAKTIRRTGFGSGSPAKSTSSRRSTPLATTSPSSPCSTSASSASSANISSSRSSSSTPTSPPTGAGRL